MAGLSVKDQVLRGMNTLLACLCTSLGASGWEGDCCLEAGEVSWDQCLNEGQKAWARLVDVYPTTRYPLQGEPTSPASDVASWAMTVELGATVSVCPDKCVCEVKTLNATAVAAAVGAGLEAVACCDLDRCGDEDVRVVSVNTRLSEAGCAGFEMQVVMPLSLCCPE